MRLLSRVMRVGRGATLILSFLLLAPLAALAPRVAADTSPPTITDVRWTPHYPIHFQNVTVYANISDPDGVNPGSVFATWCDFVGRCTFHNMVGVENGTYQTTDVTTLPATAGATMEIYATDKLFNSGNTAAYTVLFIDSLNVTVDPPVVEAHPGASVAVNGTAFYGPRLVPRDGENRSAPAVGIIVNVTVDGTTTPSTVDAAGHFSATMTAPSTEGTFPIAAAGRDRNLTGSDSGSMAVSIEPKPDLTILNAQVSPTDPEVGHQVTLSFDAANNGTANASGVRVVVDLVRGGTTNRLLSATISIPKGGGSVHEVVPWTETEAVTEQVWIRIDPDNNISELDEGNNVVALNVTYHAAPPNGDFLGIPAVGWVGGLGIVAAVVVLAVILSVRRRRAKGTPILSPEEEGKS